MKKLLTLVLILGVIGMTLSCKVDASEYSNPYSPYANFEEVYKAYQEAVANGDELKQEELLEIGRRSLYKEIEVSEKQALNARIDPDELYWKQQFPTYFSYGYFEQRSNGWTLSLGSKNQGVWTSTAKSNGWNSVYAKFKDNSHWNNTDIMKEQFYCHARIAYSTMEEEWNLEPWRTSMNPITCN